MAIAARPSGKTIRGDFVLCRSSVRALLSWEQSSFAQRRLLHRTSAGHPSRGSRAHRMPLGSAPSTFLTAERLKPVSGAGSPPLVLGADRYSAKALVQRRKRPHGHDGSVGKDDRKLRSFPRRRSHMAPRTLIYFALVLATVFLSISQHGLNGVGGCHAHDGLAWHCHE